MLGLPRGQLVPEPWGCPNAFAVRHLSVPLAASVKALPDYLWASEQSQAGPGPLCLCQERFSNPFRWGGEAQHLGPSSCARHQSVLVTDHQGLRAGAGRVLGSSLEQVGAVCVLMELMV